MTGRRAQSEESVALALAAAAITEGMLDLRRALKVGGGDPEPTWCDEARKSLRVLMEEHGRLVMLSREVR